MLDTWLRHTIQHLFQLAELPFDQLVHEDYFSTIGWQVIRKDWYPPTCFEIHFPEIGRRIISVYDIEEMSIALGLFVLCSELSVSDIVVSSTELLDENYGCF